MASIAKPFISVTIPNYNEKNDNGRQIKPLPKAPILLPQHIPSTIDDSSRIHTFSLLNNWLTQLNMPLKPWADVLFNIAMSLFEKALSSTTTSDKNAIWIQTFSNNAPIESKFLPHVFHGKLVPTDELSIDFPIGGTIRIYGLNDSTITSSKLIDLVQALVYLTYCLYLESFVMQDSHVELIISSNAKKRTDGSATQAKLDTENDSNNKVYSKRSSGLLGWFRKFAPHHHSTSTLPPTPPPSILNERTQPKRRSNPLNTVGEGIKRGLSLSNIAKKYQDPPSMPLQHDVGNIKIGDPHRFYKLKQKIEHAYISTSPECHFPYPALLNRLEIEEDELIVEQRKLMMNSNDMMECETPTSTRPMQRRRRSSLISSFSSLKRNSLTTDTTEIQLPQSTTAYCSIRTPSLLAESKKGLDHLNLDTNSLKSFKHHQSITVGFTIHPIGCPDRPCLGPIMSKMDYFRYHAPENIATTVFPNIDQTLGHAIRHWCTISQSSCQIHIDEQTRFVPGLLVETPLPSVYSSRPETLVNSKSSESSVYTLGSSVAPYMGKPIHRQCSKFHGCNQPLLDHAYSFAHGIGKVNVYTSVDPTCLAIHKDKITTWIACSHCDKSTSPILLNEKSDHFSFAKYLELIFYSSKLASPQPFCEHTQKEKVDKNVLVRCFHFNGMTIRFIYEDTKFYELRVPRIQMGPEEPAPLGFNDFSAPRIGIHTLKEWKNKSATQDVDVFFQSVRTHLDLLNHYTKAEGRRKIRQCQHVDQIAAKQTQAELKSLEGEIKALSKRLDNDHQSLLSILVDTHVNELNDFRRYFAIQSESIIQYLSDWQKRKCTEVTDEIGWDSPDYISSKSVHCFPGSSVLVREDEPSSIIAYTLSSNDYIQEILLDEGTEYSEKSSVNNTNSSKNPSMPSLSSTGSTNNTEFINSEPVPPVPPLPDKKPLPQPPSNILDGYYSSIERKYISPSTGAGTETASFRSMMIEVVKSSVVEAQMTHTKRLEELKAKLSPWARRQQEELETEGDLKRQQLTERTLKPLTAIQQPQETKEVKLSSYFYEDNAVKEANRKNVSPHINHRFVHEGVEFTCIVYYAREFELLRKQCDINQLMIQSLSRCQSWTASGGKSKSHFYKTQDDRLVIKEMMNAWNVVEKDAFLKFAPKYFDHMKKSANEPSVLAKIFGFFTIRMNNTLDKKAPIINLDVLVMEHLFYNQNIIKRFDFKGIQDRHVDEFRKQQKDITLWDGDWIQEYRTRLSVHEQSKDILEQAIVNDTGFLSKCNIMDYSLLVGIDNDKHEMTVGIVDFIGAYTWYKKIESKSKSTLQPRKEVTVVPPDQYRLRFCREVCDYFIPVPGKFDLVAPLHTLPSLLI